MEVIGLLEGTEEIGLEEEVTAMVGWVDIGLGKMGIYVAIDGLISTLIGRYPVRFDRRYLSHSSMLL